MTNAERIAQIMAELGDMGRELDVLARAADRPIVRRDVDSLCETAERMLPAHVRWAELYRTLLVFHVGRSTRTGPVPDGWGGPELSSL
jgi:cation diffusion facilitator CzcD-associated flavoprotein CzcO